MTCLLSLFGPAFRVEADADGRIQVFNRDGSDVALPKESDNMIKVELTPGEAAALLRGRDFTPTNDRDWVRARAKLRAAIAAIAPPCFELDDDLRNDNRGTP